MKSCVLFLSFESPFFSFGNQVFLSQTFSVGLVLYVFECVIGGIDVYVRACMGVYRFES